MAKRPTDSEDQRFPEWWRRKSLRHYVYEQNWRGMKVIRAWPKPKGPARTPAEANSENLFKKLAHAQMNAWPVDRAFAEAIAQGSQYTWRDVLGRMFVGRLSEWEFETPEASDVNDIQWLLDQVSDQPGSLLFRTTEQWVVIVNPDDKPVLTWNITDSGPNWEEWPELGITELTGDVVAGPGTGDQVATLSDTGVTPGTYTNANVQVDSKGRVVDIEDGSGGSGITELTGDVEAGPGSGAQAATLSNTGVVAGTYLSANVEVDTKGRVLNIETGTVAPTAQQHPGYVSGLYYARPIMQVAQNVSLTTNRIYCVPWYIARDLPFDAAQIYLSSASASGLAELGIYDNNNGLPDALLHDFGTVSTTGANGVRTITSLSGIMPIGWCWAALAVNQVCNVAHANSADTSLMSLLGLTGLNVSIFGTGYRYMTWTFAANSLPSTFTLTGNGTTPGPLIALRAA